MQIKNKRLVRPSATCNCVLFRVDIEIQLVFTSEKITHLFFQCTFNDVSTSKTPQTMRKAVSLIVPTQSFGKTEQKMKCECSIDLKMVRSPNRVLLPLKRSSKKRISSFVSPSKSSFGRHKNTRLQQALSTWYFRTASCGLSNRIWTTL